MPPPYATAIATKHSLALTTSLPSCTKRAFAHWYVGEACEDLATLKTDNDEDFGAETGEFCSSEMIQEELAVAAMRCMEDWIVYVIIV